MKPQEFLDVADRLLKRDDADEAARRSAVSRAYYAAFGVIAGEIDKNVAPLPRGSVHDLLLQYLRNSNVAAALPLADDLGDLRDRRVEADYRMSKLGPTINTARLNVLLAKTILRRFDEIPRAELLAGIKAYRKDVRKE